MKRITRRRVEPFPSLSPIVSFLSTLSSTSSTVTAASCFQGLDCILLLTGCKVYRLNRWTCVLNWIFRIHCILVVYYAILIKIVYISSDPDVVFTFNVSLIHVFELIQQHYVMFRVNKIAKFHNFLIQGLDEKQLRYLKFMTWIMLLIYLIVCGFCCWMYYDFIVASDETALIIFNFYAPIPVNETSKAKTYGAYYLMLFYFTWIRNGWQMVSCMLYYYFLKCMKFYDDKWKTSLLQYRKTDKLDFRVLFQERILIKNIKETFESLMSFFPFLWFAFNFISMITILIVLFRLGFETSFPTETLLTYYNMFLNFIVLNTITNVKIESRKLSNQVIEFLYREGRLQEPFKLETIHDLTDNVGYNFTASGLFPLEKDLIPSFAGALISFAVLFVQLSQINNNKS